MEWFWAGRILEDHLPAPLALAGMPSTRPDVCALGRLWCCCLLGDDRGVLSTSVFCRAVSSSSLSSELQQGNLNLGDFM